MKPTIKTWILRPLVILLAVFAILVAVGIIILETEQENIVNFAVTQLNKQFRGELTIRKSSISPFRHFPYVSVALHDVRFFGDKDTTRRALLSLEKLYVGFSLPDILRQTYNVRKLSLHGGYLELIRETDGTINLLAAERFGPDAAAADTTSPTARINLRNVMLKDIRVSFLDKTSGRKFAARIEKLNAAFQLSGDKMIVGVKSLMNLDFTSRTDTSFFRHKRFDLALVADYLIKEQRLEISSGAFKLQEASFNISGSADMADSISVDFKIKGEKPDISLIAAFLPGDVKARLKPFKYDGEIYFDGVLKGMVSKDHLPLIDVSFGCRDAWFLNTGADAKLDQLGFKGHYTNGAEHSLRTSELHITNVTARPEKGIFNGNFIVRDFTDPHTLIQINSELELKFLGDFLGIPDLQQIKGKIKLDMDFKELKGIVLPEQSLNKLKEGIQSKLLVEGLTFRIPGYPYLVRDMNLQAEMKDGRITVDSVSLRIGDSDLKMNGSVSDIHGFLHDRQKQITLTLNAQSHKIVLRDLIASDTARFRRMKEEVHGFNVSLMLETSVAQLLNPNPLPKGKFEVKNLRASFKRYPHTFKDVGATMTVDDTLLRLQNFAGMVDKSDIHFGGRVINYALWFRNIKKGKTQIAFDFKSNHFAVEDFLSPITRKYIPEGYRHEEAGNVWVRAKVDLRYDTVFKFAKAHIANVTGDLKNHNFSLKDIKGNVKYGANRVLVLDTLTGTIGRSDFDVTLHLFAGADKKMKKRTNYLKFNSKFLDVDELSRYEAAAADPNISVPKTLVPGDSSKHAKAFNIFLLPFIDFRADVVIGKMKYEKLWVKDVTARLRMQEDHHIYLDTIAMKVADGVVGVKGQLNGSDPKQIYLTSTIMVDQVDLEKVMLKLDHFGQDVMINKNLKGRISGSISSDVLVHPNLVPQVNNTKAEMDITIYNGSLNDFAPMQAMASYFRDKNIRMIRFDTLQNKLTFVNGVLNIPSMAINSSLGYIELSGKQSIDLTMEYYVRVPMKMVTKVGFSALFDHKPEAVDVTQVDEIDYSEKDKKIHFMNLKVTGTPEDFKVGLGKDKTKK